MDIPQPPDDEDLRNIIDKLAVFVGRNGQEFEAMTKQKQQNNPRFQFLFGGEYYNYYMYRVTSEQAVLKHNQNREQQMGGNSRGFEDRGGFQGPQGNFNQFNQMQGQGGGGPGSGSRGQGSNQRGFVPSLFEQNIPNPFEQQQFNEPPFEQQQRQQQQRQGFQEVESISRQPRRGFSQTPNPNFTQDSGSPGRSKFSQHPPQQQRRNHWDERPPNRSQQFDNYGDQQPHSNDFQDFGDREMKPFGFDDSSQQQRQPPQGENPFDIKPNPSSLPPPGLVTPSPPIPSLEQLTAQKLAFEEQIKQSEQNLAGQQQLLLQQQQAQIEEALRTMTDNEITTLALELNVNIGEFDRILSNEHCTKEAISAGKAWIFTHTPTTRHYHLVTLYLMRRATNANASFNERLHIIYLINDVLHHCGRKGAEDLQIALESIVVPMFCYTKISEARNEENVSKLDKLFSLWETKSNYISSQGVRSLQNYNQTWLDYKKSQISRNAVLVNSIATAIQQTYAGYENQHQLFCQHIVQNIQQIEQQIQQAVLLKAAQTQQQAQLMVQMAQQAANQQQQPQIPISAQSGFSGPGQGQEHFIKQEQSIPDLSRPPPGFPTPPPNISDKDLIPGLPYYELPAGLMVPLVKPEDDAYKPIDPSAIRLPPPCPPNEKLLQAVEAFYAPAMHDRPRDSEGWEKLGLYEFYKMKNLARKQKEDDIRDGKRKKSRSPSPIRRDSSPGGRSPPRRRYQSKSPTPPSSKSSSSSRRRSRSRSPSSSSKRRRRRSRSRSPIRRSPTPPSFTGMGTDINMKLDESNKGHQLLKKMGWGGTGLGLNEQGISAPISGGEVRDTYDKFKGIGMNVNDPFEAFRKNKSQNFITRMRQRADERT